MNFRLLKLNGISSPSLCSMKLGGLTLYQPFALGTQLNSFRSAWEKVYEVYEID